MSINYIKISDTEVKVVKTTEIVDEKIYTEAELNKAILDIDTEIAQLNNKKSLLQSELSTITSALKEEQIN